MEPNEYAKFQSNLNRLKNNDPTLTEYTLFHNHISPTELKMLIDSLKDNHSLVDLCIWHIAIRDEGLIAFAEVLKDNHTIKRIELKFLNAGDEGAIAIANMLKGNHTVEKLVLWGNKIGPKGFKAFAKCLMYNHTLRLVTFDYMYNKNLMNINDLLNINELIRFGELHDTVLTSALVLMNFFGPSLPYQLIGGLDLSVDTSILDFYLRDYKNIILKKR